MASSVKIRDKNRFKKTYSFVRRKKKNTFFSDDAGAISDLVIEVGVISFTGNESKALVFTESFTATPSITITPVDSEGNDTANINATVSSASTAGFTADVSDSFTGDIHYQAIQVL